MRVWLRRGSGWVGPRTARIPGIPLGLGPAVDRVGFSADGRRAMLRIEVQGVPPFYVTPFFSVVVDTSTGRLLTPVFGTAAAPVAQGLAIAALSPDGSRLAVADRSGRVDIHPVGAAWNQGVVRLVGRSPGSSLGWDPSGRTVVVGREDGSVETFDARTADHRSDFPGHDKPLLVSQFTEDGRMLVTLDDGGLLLAHATRAGSVVSTVAPVPRPHAIATGPTGSVLAVGLENGHVALFDQRRLSRLPVDLWLAPTPPATPRRPPRCTDVSRRWPSHRTARRSWRDRLGHLRMWSVPDGRLLWSQDDVPVSFLAVFPDGRYVATAGFTQPTDDPAPDGSAENSSVTLRDLRVGHQVAVRGTGQRKPAAIAFSPDSRTLAVGFFEDTADVLDGRTLARQATMPQSATAVAFAPDGHQLLAVSFDGTVTAYEKPAWRAAASFRTNADGHVHLAYSTGGQFLLISDARATSLWDADRHKLIAEPLSLHGDGTNDALFLAPVPETDVVYLASQTALARLDMNPARWRRQACFLAGRRLTRDEWRRYLPDLSYRPACGSAPPVPVPPS